MGSQIKHSIFQESTELAIHGWHEKVKEKRKKRKLNHRPVSSSIHKTFGLSSKLKHHNSTPCSVRLSKGHATKSTPMDQVNMELHDTQDIVQSDNSKLSGKNSISFLCNNTYSMKKGLHVSTSVGQVPGLEGQNRRFWFQLVKTKPEYTYLIPAKNQFFLVVN